MVDEVGLAREGLEHVLGATGSRHVDNGLQAAIQVSGLTKSYGELRAVDGISFKVEEHEIFGFLGPNGAGKTTTIKCMVTLTRPTSGNVEVFGADAASRPDTVRRDIGYVPQSLSLVSEITGYENLLISGKLYGVPRTTRRERIREILELMDLEERGDDLVRTYSGGMMRRLEIGAALVHNPRLLILDEPTIGLDPQGRHVIWDLLQQLVEEMGITIFMTTHDMAEADELCRRIAIINRGKIVATGTPGELKKSIGGDMVVIETPEDPRMVGEFLGKEPGVQVAAVGNGSLSVVVGDSESSVPVLLVSLSKAGIAVSAISAQKPTLDDVFLKYAGSRMQEAEAGSDWRQIRQVRRTFRRMG